MQILTLCRLRFRGIFSRAAIYLMLVGGIGIFATSLLGGVVIGEMEEVVKDLGLKVISFFGVVVCVFSGAGELRRDIQERSIHTLLSKPVSRVQFICGKAAGLFSVVSLQVVILCFFLWLMLFFMGKDVGFPIIKAAVLILGEILVVAAMITFFSTFTTPYLSGFFTFSLYIIGLFLHDFYTFGLRFGEPTTRKALMLLYYILPDFEGFHITGRIVYGAEIGWIEVDLVLLYGISYSIFLFMLTGWFFRKRDI